MSTGLDNFLSRLTEPRWTRLRRIAAQGRRWHELPWLHNKYYKENPPNDGWALQRPRVGDSEVPYRRELFHPSPRSRFSLGDRPVAYFSADFAVNCCETIEQFTRDSELTWESLGPYLRGVGNPTPGWMGYPIHPRISPEALLFDVSGLGTPVMREFLESSAQEDHEDLTRLLTTRDDTLRQQTQLLSKQVHQHGFHGLVYASVRAPVDIMLPDWNLVMFEKRFVHWET